MINRIDRLIIVTRIVSIVLTLITIAIFDLPIPVAIICLVSFNYRLTRYSKASKHYDTYVFDNLVTNQYPVTGDQELDFDYYVMWLKDNRIYDA